MSLLGIPVVLGVFMTLAAIPSAPQESVISVAALILVALGIFLGVPLCIVIANDHFKRAGALKRQSRSSEVLVCEGPVEEAEEKIRRRVGDDPEVVLEVLAQSGLVWTINGRPQESWLVAPRVRTAGSPEQARLAARYVRPVETEGGTFRLHQRALSEEERVELRSYLPRVTLALGALILLLNAGAASQVVLYARNPTGVPLVGVVLLAGVVWCDGRLVVAMRTRLRMLRDLGEGFVVIYQPDGAATASEESVVEFLPHSGAEWTTGGRAAPWRRWHGTVTAG